MTREKLFDSVPNWCQMRLKYVLREVGPRSKTGIGLPLSVTQDRGVIPSSEAKIANPPSTYIGAKQVVKGNLVFNKLKAHLGVFAISNYDGLVSPDYAVYESLDARTDLRYFHYLLTSPQYIDQFVLRISGVAEGLRRLYTSDLFDISVPVPSFEQQASIADYLDKKCLEIDRAIEAAESSIEEYKLYKRSFVFQAVTKGLDPDAPMKDSGIEWLGKIPSSWELRQAGQLADQTKCKNEGMKEENLLSLSYGKVKRRDIRATEGLLPESFEGYNIIEENDIVLRFTDLQNDHKSLRVGRATERGIITSAYVTIRPYDPNDSKYLYYALHCFDLVKGFYGMGAGVRQGLKWQEAKYVIIPYPSKAERVDIVARIESLESEILCLVERRRRVIEELKAYKKSLIWEAVTGKREI